MKFIKLPFKHSLILTGWFVAIDYVPEGNDKNDPLLLVKRIWSMKIPFGKKPKNVL